MNPTDEANAIIKHLKRVKGLTQTEIAQKLGYNHDYLSQALNNKVSLKLLRKIKEFYSDDTILTREEVLESRVRQLQAMLTSLQQDYSHLKEKLEGIPAAKTIEKLHRDTIESLSRLAANSDS